VAGFTRVDGKLELGAATRFIDELAAALRPSPTDDDSITS